MSRFLQDLKFATRHLLKSPGFTSVAILIMALGIGANSCHLQRRPCGPARTVAFSQTPIGSSKSGMFLRRPASRE